LGDDLFFFKAPTKFKSQKQHPGVVFNLRNEDRYFKPYI